MSGNNVQSRSKVQHFSSLCLVSLALESLAISHANTYVRVGTRAHAYANVCARQSILCSRAHLARSTQQSKVSLFNMETLPKELQDLRVLRRLLFAVNYLPEDMPNFWEIVKEFIR